MKVACQSLVLGLLSLVILGACSASYSVQEDLRGTFEELGGSRLVTFDYNLSPSQSHYEEHLVLPAGTEFSFPEAAPGPQYRRVQDGIAMVFTGWDTDPGGYGTSYAVGAYSPPVNEPQTYYAQWTTLGGIGPGGGIVVYDVASMPYGFRYLEMAGLIPGLTQWSAMTITAPTSLDMGTGKANTDAILAAMTTLEGAAVVCSLFEQNGYDDWFLPSFGELGYANAYLGSSEYIWTSSMDDIYVYARRNGGDSTFAQTSASAYVRPFRSF